MSAESEERELRRRLLLNRHDPEALTALARLLRARGEALAAARLLQTFCESSPVDGDAWLELARVWAEANQPDSGLQALRQASLRGVDSIQLDVLVADLQERAGRLNEAVKAWRHILARIPESIEARVNLASVLRLTGEVEEAILLLEDAQRADPTRLSVHNNLANALKEAGRLEDAELRYAELIGREGIPGEVHFNHGLTLLQLGKGEDALKAFNTAREAGADFENCLLQIAETQISLGRFAAASITLEELLTQKPDAARALYLLAQMAPPGEPAKVLAARMRALEQHKGLPAEAREALDYGLGRLYDSTQHYPLAQKHYRAANRSARQRMLAAQRDALAQRLEAVPLTSPNAWQALVSRLAPQAGNAPTPAPLFIVGMPRSGTTLLESLLARHPDITPAGEVDALPSLLRQCTSTMPRHASLIDRQLALGADMAEQLRMAYCRRLHALGATAGRFVIDKTPFNFELLGLIHALWPQAQILHCERNVVDSCLSIYFQQFGALPFSHDLADIARVQAAYEACMAFWTRSLPTLPLQRVSYETLAAHPERTLAALGERLELRFEPGNPAPEPVGTERVIRTASRWQVRQAVSAVSESRAHQYSALAAEFNKALGRYRSKPRAPSG